MELIFFYWDKSLNFGILEFLNASEINIIEIGIKIKLEIHIPSKGEADKSFAVFSPVKYTHMGLKI